MTAHKAQGKTMDAVIMDLESTIGTESPYVMLSRATSLAGVYILRPFSQRVIQRGPSQDVREEFRRLDILCHQTVMRYGTAEEAAEAQQYLVDTFSARALPMEDQAMEHVDDEARRLASLQRATACLIAGAVRDPALDHRRITGSTSQATSSTPHRARILKTTAVDSQSISSNKRAGPNSVEAEPPLSDRVGRRGCINGDSCRRYG
ncbi:hypothetical protein B0H10DRAFT_1835467 [Mycena sp. CBHHK59/15]|nr:hypothetical protein B0H10DRAFT_1835467 [Mycena sp. CBHHK59/15]